MPDIDWKKSMHQTFKFYEVNPVSWFDKKEIDTIKNVTITRDPESETIQHASVEADNIDKELYVRIYMEIIQNRYRFRETLGTFLMTPPKISFDGKVMSSSIDAYSPLIELKEKLPDIGFTVRNNESIMESAYILTKNNVRAPVIKPSDISKRINEDSGFVADSDETWLSYLTSLMQNAEYSFDIEPNGEIIYVPNNQVDRMIPIWEYNDDDQSILFSDISIDQDIYGIPNVIEVIQSSKSGYYVAKCINDDPNSPVSTVSRGRIIQKRVTSPDTLAYASNSEIDDYAKQLLNNYSTLEFKVTYSHGYCPVRVGDCVRINYSRAGLNNIKAKVIRQTIACQTGCRVDEEAIFTKNLWREGEMVN